MFRNGVTFAAAAAGFAVCSTALAAPVPIGDCLFCAMPNPLSFPDPNVPGQNPPGCFYRRLWCDRTDGAPYQINAGVPGVVTGGTLSCRNCSNCPDCPPPPQLCTQMLQVCFTETVSFEIQVGGEAGEEIKASLAAAIGISASVEICGNVNCGSENIPPCTWASYAAKMNVKRGIVYGLDSTFTAGGKVGTHFRRRCSIEGTPWSQNCGVKTSKATGNKAFDSFCDTTNNGGC